MSKLQQNAKDSAEKTIKKKTKARRQRVVNLNALGEGMPGLTPASGLRLAEAAAVCFEKENHKSGVRLQKAGIISDDFHVDWPSVDERQRRCYADMQETTEDGACGVAILVVKEVTGLVVIERSRKKTGFDYWIGKNDYEGLPFVGIPRLEVSGILTGTKAELHARVRQKKEQMKPTDHLGGGLVAVVEFGTPIACVESK